MGLKIFLQIFGFIAVVLSLLPFVPVDFWWVRMFDFPHIQLSILTFVAFMVYFFRFDLKNWKDFAFVGILGLCLILQVSKILPYTPFSSPQLESSKSPEEHPEIGVFAANVYQPNTDYHRLLEEVQKWDADLLIFTETDKKWQEALNKGLKTQDYPYRLQMPLDNTYGMLLYSRFELINPRTRFLIEDSIPSMHAEVLLPSDQRIGLHIIHPTPPMPPHDSTSTGRDAQMMMVAQMARESEIPVIVTGDFNDVAWSESTKLFQNYSQLLDPRIGRGFYNTFNVNSFIMRWPLDHLFVSEEFRLKEIHLGKDVGSDHFPFYALLSLEPKNPDKQDVPQTSKEEMQTALKQIAKGLKKKAKDDAPTGQQP